MLCNLTEAAVDRCVWRTQQPAASKEEQVILGGAASPLYCSDTRVKSCTHGTALLLQRKEKYLQGCVVKTDSLICKVSI